MKPSVKGVLITLSTGAIALSAHALPATHPVAALHDRIDESRLVVLAGNTRPETRTSADLGRVDDARPMPHLVLQLKRSPEGEAALTRYIDALHDPASASYHQWLTPQQFAAAFGVASADVARVSAWLKSKGFTIDGVAPTGLTIEFSGTAGQVRAAFGTEIHAYDVRGVNHIANDRDPAIPTALRPAVEGIVSLHDFRPHPMHVQRGPRVDYTFNDSQGDVRHGVGAPDLATIYNLKPLFDAGITGKGQTIMVVEDTYMYSTNDWKVFRDTFGLTTAFPSATLTQKSPTGSVTCKNPGFVNSPLKPGYGDDGEATLDVEWASAAAPAAKIVLAACTDTSIFGGLIAIQNTLNGPAKNLPSVISVSYGQAEAVNGATTNASFASTYQQAVAEGVSIFVSSGDQLADVADHGNVATHGIGVNGWGSTPYNVSVGGTDFNYTANGIDSSTYWNAANTAANGSALSYIGEIPWNNSCAGSVLAAHEGLTPNQLCNDPRVTQKSGTLNFTDNAAGGSGGPSGCATGAPASAGVVGGSCAGYAKPSWQAVVGNPADGVRDLPDVALFASNGFWDAYYITCWSNPNKVIGGGGTCTGTPGTWPGFGGTSVSSPIMAGIQALVNQKTKSRWGNPNTVYYQLANTEYGKSGSVACNSATVNKSSNTCKFYDVTQGDIAGACKTAKNGAPTDCYKTAPSDVNGVISTSDTQLQPAFPTTVGWDFATGLGSVNAYNLVMGWPAN